MKLDLFLSICQTEVDGYMPSEKKMFENFFDQVFFADQLGFETAWVAETHLSCQTQKLNSDPVIPHFRGEIGLNTDILQVAHLIFAKTKRIHVGSAIRNIICNGGPIAHAEAVKTFLSLNSMFATADRQLHLGFAAGRFPFTNSAYGFSPCTDLEKKVWPVIKNKYFQQATEIFLRLLTGEQISSMDISKRSLSVTDFSDATAWDQLWSWVQTQDLAKIQCEISADKKIYLEPHWQFERVGVIPQQAPLDHLRLTVGSHDPETQILANQFAPVGVFNLSITPERVIDETHQRMQKFYNPMGGAWSRDKMPRTVMLFLDKDPKQALSRAQSAWENYWLAMEGTLDPRKVEQAVANTIAGDAMQVAELIKQKYHPQDRLMLWFDLNNHDNNQVKESMKMFMENVAPNL